MAKFQFVKGEIDVILLVFIQDSSVTTGAGLGSLDQTSSITGGYCKRGGTGVALAVDENVATEGTYAAPTTAAQVRIGTPANMTTGWYELHFHNDLFTTADYVGIGLGGASNMAPLNIEIQLMDINFNQSYIDSNLVRMGGVTQSATDLKDFADSGYDPSVNKVEGVKLADTTTTNTDLVTANAIADQVWDEVSSGHTTPGTTGELQAVTVASIADAVWDEAQADHVAAGSMGLIASEVGEIGTAGAGLTNINLPNQTMDITGNITGNLSGTVGSVTGAVGSVTGNVGGNVTGSVGSLEGHTVQTGDTFAALGTVPNLGGGATIGGNIRDIAGTTFSATTDSLEFVRNQIGIAGAGLTAIPFSSATITLPGQVVPPLAPTADEALGWVYKTLRNRTTQTATQWNLYADDETTIDAKATVSDDGTTAIKQEIVAGP